MLANPNLALGPATCARKPVPKQTFCSQFICGWRWLVLEIITNLARGWQAMRPAEGTTTEHLRHLHLNTARNGAKSLHVQGLGVGGSPPPTHSPVSVEVVVAVLVATIGYIECYDIHLAVANNGRPRRGQPLPRHFGVLLCKLRGV